MAVRELFFLKKGVGVAVLVPRIKANILHADPHVGGTVTLVLYAVLPRPPHRAGALIHIQCF